MGQRRENRRDRFGSDSRNIRRAPRIDSRSGPKLRLHLYGADECSRCETDFASFL